MLRLHARRGTDITARYPELTAADIGLDATTAVVDGEIVALDAAGRPSFARLQARMHLTGTRQIDAERRRTPVRYHLFDVLALDGVDVAPRPLRDRRALLERIAASTAAAVVVPPVFDDVGDALETAQRLALEGIVVKDPASGYRRGVRSDQWLKVKLTRTQEVVIGGIRPGRGGRTGQIGSLMLGIPDGDGLRYVGRVGSGFSESTLARLQEVLEPLRTDADPFVGVPAVDARDALWVRPAVVGEVEFAEFSPGGALRHARWRGLRPDKAPSEVRRED
jgi:bifunctional non-homologous end joining protein LigD